MIYLKQIKLFDMKTKKENLVLLIGMILVLGTYLVGCEKVVITTPPVLIPPVTPVTSTVLIGKIGKGTVNPDSSVKVVKGKSITITATPDSNYSLYSLKIYSFNSSTFSWTEEENVEITPTTSSFRYSLRVDFNIKVVFEFVETDNLIISVLNPPWRLKAIEDFYPNGELFFDWPLTELELSLMCYFLYPEGKLLDYLPDGSLYFSANWHLVEKVLTIGLMKFPIVELTPTKLVYKMQQVEGGIYTLYTYERN